MYKKALVVGKFYPPHRGHKLLIDTATAQSEELTILICSTKEQWIPGDLRAQWLAQIHPIARIIHLHDDMPGDDDSEGWAAFTIKLLGFVPDAVFTSEDYGDAYARFMGSTHVCVDKARIQIPISGTKVRSNPLRYLEYLEPCVRAHFVPRIAVVGAESTGTTTLSRSLAEHYRTVWVPEYGRMYSEGRQHARVDWQSDEFDVIARSQVALEDALAIHARGVVICDTDPFATTLWHERYMGDHSSTVAALADGRTYALYILTGDEIPFVQDGLRDGEHIRHAMHARFIERLEESGRKYVLVTGTPEERLAQAVAAIDALID